VRGPGQIQVLSCYELGHQPLAAASAVAFLERAGFRPATLDLAVEPLDPRLDEAAARPPGLVAISVPMHTAMHIGVRAARRIRQRLPRTHVCFYGLYATLNAEHLFRTGLADSVAGGEFEAPLVGLAEALAAERPITGVDGLGLPDRPAPPHLARLDFPVPSRAGLPDPSRYARLVVGGQERLAAAIEGSRGCLHRCRHCPIPAVYGGRFFIVPKDVVLADVDGLVDRGVRHLTFADPDFLNGPRHALAVARAIHAAHPHVTFDVTTKIEHVLRHRPVFPELAAMGCLFVVSAVESLSDTVLRHLDKGHTRDDVLEAERVLDGAGIAFRPSLLPFTPWSTLDDYEELLDWVEGHDLVHAVDPVQWSIRLLVPPRSLLAGSPALLPFLGPLDAATFSHPWAHPDPRMDRLQREVAGMVAAAAKSSEPAESTFAGIRRAADRAAGRTERRARLPPARPIPPRLSEPWFC
jgi:radical SAM superfamily enzyme YgiQ (UPF0313 family)